jgi:hypothetical protein
LFLPPLTSPLIKKLALLFFVQIDTVVANVLLHKVRNNTGLGIKGNDVADTTIVFFPPTALTCASTVVSFMFVVYTPFVAK